MDVDIKKCIYRFNAGYVFSADCASLIIEYLQPKYVVGEVVSYLIERIAGREYIIITPDGKQIVNTYRGAEWPRLSYTPTRGYYVTYAFGADSYSANAHGYNRHEGSRDKALAINYMPQRGGDTIVGRLDNMIILHNGDNIYTVPAAGVCVCEEQYYGITDHGEVFKFRMADYVST